MRDIAVVIVTVDRRPRKNYLADTLSNLARSGAWGGERLHSIHVVDSGGSDEWPDDGIIDFAYASYRSGEPVVPIPSNVIAVHRTETRRNGKQNFATALEVGARSGARWVVVLEDDVDFVDDFVDGVGRWLDDCAVPRAMFYPLCGNHMTIAHRALAGLNSWDYPIEAFWGFQAIATRPVEALSFAEWLRQNPDYIHADGRKDSEAHDLEMHRWAVANRIRSFVGSCPSFVQHVGVESVINPTRDWDVSFPSWPGRDWSYPPTQQKQQQQESK